MYWQTKLDFLSGNRHQWWPSKYEYFTNAKWSDYLTIFHYKISTRVKWIFTKLWKKIYWLKPLLHNSDIYSLKFFHFSSNIIKITVLTVNLSYRYYIQEKGITLVRKNIFTNARSRETINNILASLCYMREIFRSGDP